MRWQGIANERAPDRWGTGGREFNLPAPTNKFNGLHPLFRRTEIAGVPLGYQANDAAATPSRSVTDAVAHHPSSLYTRDRDRRSLLLRDVRCCVTLRIGLLTTLTV